MQPVKMVVESWLPKSQKGILFQEGKPEVRVYVEASELSRSGIPGPDRVYQGEVFLVTSGERRADGIYAKGLTYLPLQEAVTFYHELQKALSADDLEALEVVYKLALKFFNAFSPSRRYSLREKFSPTFQFYLRQADDFLEPLRERRRQEDKARREEKKRLKEEKTFQTQQTEAIRIMAKIDLQISTFPENGGVQAQKFSKWLKQLTQRLHGDPNRLIPVYQEVRRHAENRSKSDKKEPLRQAWADLLPQIDEKLKKLSNRSGNNLEDAEA